MELVESLAGTRTKYVPVTFEPEDTFAFLRYGWQSWKVPVAPEILGWMKAHGLSKGQVRFRGRAIHVQIPGPRLNRDYGAAFDFRDDWFVEAIAADLPILDEPVVQAKVVEPNILHFQVLGPSLNREYGVALDLPVPEAVYEAVRLLPSTEPSLAGTGRRYVRAWMRYAAGLIAISFTGREEGASFEIRLTSPLLEDLCEWHQRVAFPLGGS